ncbi:MAG: hypothetical protein J6W82_08225, partial [Bacteroidales bacterium]|nr:hypothetical protein [Bacteroidales bacterium]
MKKWFNIAVLAVLVSLAACTKVENAPEVKETISYTVGSYAQATKATVELSETDRFYSSAWIHANGASTGASYFTAETISKTSTTWEPSHDYYWPKDPQSYINFVSWFDKNAAPGSANAPVVTETSITWNNRTIADDDNIIVADKAWKQTSNYDHKYYTPGIPTLFRHLLAQVEVRAKVKEASETDATTGVTTSWSVTVKNFTINNVYTQGTLALTNAIEPDADSDGLKISAWTGNWDFEGCSTTNISGSSSQALNANDFEDILAMCSVIPQATAAITMSFQYEVTTVTSKS